MTVAGHGSGVLEAVVDTKTQPDLKQRIQDSLEQSGELASIKSQVRSRLFKHVVTSLQKKPAGNDDGAKLPIPEQSWELRIIDQLVIEYLKKRNFKFCVQVLYPEAHLKPHIEELPELIGSETSRLEFILASLSTAAEKCQVSTQTESEDVHRLQRYYDDIQSLQTQRATRLEATKESARSSVNDLILKWERQYLSFQKAAMDAQWERKCELHIMKTRESCRAQFEREVERIRGLVQDRQPERSQLAHKVSCLAPGTTKPPAAFAPKVLEKVASGQPRMVNADASQALSRARRAIEAQVNAMSDSNSEV